MSKDSLENAKAASVDIDQYWLNKAIKESQKAESINEVPVGAVLVSNDNTLIASAHNKPIITHNATAHAEIEAIKAAGKIKQNYRLTGTTLYVTLEPCPMCAGAIVHARVARVVFAAKDFRSGACGSVLNLHENQNLNHRFIADFIERPDYIAQLKAFFKRRR